MIGEDQANGYQEDEEEQTEAPKETTQFQDSKKKALAMIGRAGELNLSLEETEKLNESVMPNKEESVSMKINGMQHDMIVLRGQVNEMVNVFNRVQTGIRDNFTRMINRLDNLESNINKKLSDFESKLERK